MVGDKRKAQCEPLSFISNFLLHLRLVALDGFLEMINIQKQLVQIHIFVSHYWKILPCRNDQLKPWLCPLLRSQCQYFHKILSLRGYSPASLMFLSQFLQDNYDSRVGLKQEETTLWEHKRNYWWDSVLSLLLTYSSWQ